MAPPKKLRTVTVDQAIDGYEQWLRHRLTTGAISQSTADTYLSDLAEFRLLAGGGTILDSITADNIQAMLDRLSQTPDRRYTATAPPGRRRARATLARWSASTRGLFRWAARQAFLQTDPWPDVSAPTFPARTPDYRRGVDVPTARHLRDAPDQTRPATPQGKTAAARLGLRDQIILRLLTETGPRVSELCAVNRQDVRNGNLTGGGPPSWQLVVTGKGQKTRVLPMSDSLVAMINTYQSELRPPPPASLPESQRRRHAAALLVSINGRRLSPRDVQRVVARHARTLDVHTTPHSLRHTALTAMGHAGVPVSTIRDIAGHESLSTTSIYVDSDPAAAAAALRRSPLGQH